MTESKLREAVGVFHEEETLQNAVDELLINGFDRADLNLVAGHKTVEEKLGHDYRLVREIEDDPDVPYRAYAGRDSRTEAKSAVLGGLAYVGAVAAAGMVLASGGTVAAALVSAAAAGGAGGLVGGLFARFMDRGHARYLEEQIDRGGLLLWVRADGKERERKATEILKRYSAEDVHVHDLPNAHAALREAGVSKELSWLYKPFGARLTGARR